MYPHLVPGPLQSVHHFVPCCGIVRCYCQACEVCKAKSEKK